MSCSRAEQIRQGGGAARAWERRRASFVLGVDTHLRDLGVLGLERISNSDREENIPLDTYQLEIACGLPLWAPYSNLKV